MSNIDELSRLVGQLESKIETLFHKQDRLCGEVKSLVVGLAQRKNDFEKQSMLFNNVEELKRMMTKRKLWDSLKIVTGAFLGGFAAVIAKTFIWK